MFGKQARRNALALLGAALASTLLIGGIVAAGPASAFEGEAGVEVGPVVNFAGDWVADEELQVQPVIKLSADLEVKALGFSRTTKASPTEYRFEVVNNGPNGAANVRIRRTYNLRYLDGGGYYDTVYLPVQTLSFNEGASFARYFDCEPTANPVTFCSAGFVQVEYAFDPQSNNNVAALDSN